jgi:serine/threonine-protein kinase
MCAGWYLPVDVVASKSKGPLQIDALFHERYRVAHCIKAGGMGAVYEVVDEKTNSRRALKVMLTGALKDPDLRARFELEARITGTVESDHIVRVSDAGVDAETQTPFLVMDLLRGHDLGRVVEEGPPLTAEETVLYLGQAARALDKTHAAGVVHRDLKPENLFLTQRDDGSICVKLLDFGIAKVVEREAEAKGTRTMGTPSYMAPEQIRGDGKIAAAADVYALGQIAYSLLVGEEYWHEEAVASGSTFAFFLLVVKGLTESATVRAKRTRVVILPEGFDGWMAQACALDPIKRFPSAGAAVTALAEVLGTRPPAALSSLTLLARSSMPALAVTAVVGEISTNPTVPNEAPAHRRTDTNATLRAGLPTMAEPEPVVPMTKPPMRLLGAAIGAAALAVGLIGWRLGRASPVSEPPRLAATAPAITAALPPVAVNTPQPEVTPSADAPPPIPVATAPASASSAPAASPAPSPSTAPRRPPPKPSAAPAPPSKPHGLM